MGLTAGVAMTKTQVATKAPAKATITIRHQTHGCHSWSVNSGASRASLTTTLARGGTIRFVDNDVMSHKLIKTSGPAVRYVGNPGDAPHERVGQRHFHQGRHLSVHDEGRRRLPAST